MGHATKKLLSLHPLLPSARMREGYCSRPVCLSVYPSVPALAASASVETSKQRYSRVRLFLDFDSWIFEKTFRSKVIA